MGLGILVKVGGAVDPELAAAGLVEVHERMGEPTTYRLRYAVDIIEDDLPPLVDPRLGPGSELSIVVPVDTEEQVLVLGPVHGQRARLQHRGTGSWVEVLGSDRSVEMDREVKAQIWDGTTASDVVRAIVSEYDLEADIEDTSAQFVEATHTLVQRDTDLRFVRRLARRYGYLFWLTTDATGRSTAHLRRPPLDGEPAATLVINRTNPTVSSLDVAWDVERPTSAVAAQVSLNDKQDLDGSVAVSPLAALGTEPLGSIAGGTRTVQVIAPADEAGDLVQRAEGALIEAGWFVRAVCETSLSVLGQLVRAHTIVEVQGAGSRHSGKYFVGGVRHRIDASAHGMEVELYRNAWGT